MKTMNKLTPEKIATLWKESFEHLEAVNYGGCGWSAYVVCRALKRRGINATIHFINPSYVKDFVNRSGKPTLNRCCRQVSINRIEDGWRFPNDHLVLKVGDLYLDSDGVNHVDSVYEEPISLGVLKRSLKTATWNRTFRQYNDNWFAKKNLAVKKFNSKLKEALS